MDWGKALDLDKALYNVEQDVIGDWYRDPWGWPELRFAAKENPNIVTDRAASPGVRRVANVSVPKEALGPGQPWSWNLWIVLSMKRSWGDCRAGSLGDYHPGYSVGVCGGAAQRQASWRETTSSGSSSAPNSADLSPFAPMVLRRTLCRASLPCP
jgi:hypothetical protein